MRRPKYSIKQAIFSFQTLFYLLPFKLNCIFFLPPMSKNSSSDDGGWGDLKSTKEETFSPKENSPQIDDPWTARQQESKSEDNQVSRKTDESNQTSHKESQNSEKKQSSWNDRGIEWPSKSKSGENDKWNNHGEDGDKREFSRNAQYISRPRKFSDQDNDYRRKRYIGQNDRDDNQRQEFQDRNRAWRDRPGYNPPFRRDYRWDDLVNSEPREYSHDQQRGRPKYSSRPRVEESSQYTGRNGYDNGSPRDEKSSRSREEPYGREKSYERGRDSEREKSYERGRQSYERGRDSERRNEPIGRSERYGQRSYNEPYNDSRDQRGGSWDNSQNSQRNYSPQRGYNRGNSDDAFSRGRRLIPVEPEPTNVIGLFGLSSNATLSDIKDFLNEKIPHIRYENVNLVMDRYTGISRGFGFIYFTSVEDAKSAKEQLVGKSIYEKPIRVDYAVNIRAKPAGFEDENN